MPSGQIGVMELSRQAHHHHAGAGVGSVRVGEVQVGVEGGVILLESKYDFAADKQQTNGLTN
jgi:hypothetical protein